MLGNWVDQKTEFAQISITSSMGELWLTTRGKEYKINNVGEKYAININNREYLLYYNDVDRVLSFNNIFYIREKESLKYAFLGTWSSVNKEESLVFDIRVERGGLLWEVIKNQEEPIQYFPKRTKEGFAFTYENQLLFFTIVDNCIVDSTGRKFCKS
jgi:hypothetical protein